MSIVDNCVDKNVNNCGEGVENCVYNYVNNFLWGIESG